MSCMSHPCEQHLIIASPCCCCPPDPEAATALAPADHPQVGRVGHTGTNTGKAAGLCGKTVPQRSLQTTPQGTFRQLPREPSDNSLGNLQTTPRKPSYNSPGNLQTTPKWTFRKLPREPWDNSQESCLSTWGNSRGIEGRPAGVVFPQNPNVFLSLLEFWISIQVGWETLLLCTLRTCNQFPKKLLPWNFPWGEMRWNNPTVNS